MCACARRTSPDRTVHWSTSTVPSATVQEALCANPVIVDHFEEEASRCRIASVLRIGMVIVVMWNTMLVDRIPVSMMEHVIPASQPNQSACLCDERHYGDTCALSKAHINLSVATNRSAVGVVIQFFDYHPTSLSLILADQRVYSSVPVSIIYHRDDTLIPPIVLARLYSSFDHRWPDIYLLSLQLGTVTTKGETEISETNRCPHVRTLLTGTSPFQYHHVCRNNSHLICFHDDVYLCICANDQIRAECFLYDHRLDQCEHCLADGRCLRGDFKRQTDFLCLCPACHSGAQCQFSSQSFTITLDQLFYTDLVSTHRQAKVILIILLPLLSFTVAIPSNLFSFVTLRRPSCLRNGVGHYLLALGIVNQLCLTFLTACLIHLTVSITGGQPSSVLNTVFCKLFNYCLTCSTRLSYWLSSWIALERVYTVIFLNKQWFKQPRIARRLILITCILIALTAIDELIFIKSFSAVEGGHGSMCVADFSLRHRSLRLLLHQFVSITNLVVPLLINIGCTFAIIAKVIRTKLNLQKTTVS